jgi:CRP/FNR family transcriptional regulator, cyclic AMP receptor protein
MQMALLGRPCRPNRWLAVARRSPRRETPGYHSFTRRCNGAVGTSKVKTGPDIATATVPPLQVEEAVPDVIPSALARLTDEQREALIPYAAKASWPAGFMVYQRGAPADGLFVVVRGRIVLRSRVRAGRSFVPGIATRNETFGSEGLQAGGRYATDARAEEESETLFLGMTSFRAFVREQPQHAITLLGQLMAERASLLDKLRELTTLSVEQRIVATFSRFAHTDIFAGEGGRITLSPQQYRLLCELVGATRESVSLVLSRLSAEGLVERRGSTMVLPTLPVIMERSAPVESDLSLASLESPTAEQAIH